MKEHLEIFLQEAQALNPEPQHIKEVCFLYVQCMEVSVRCMNHHKQDTLSSMLIHDCPHFGKFIVVIGVSGV